MHLKKIKFLAAALFTLLLVSACSKTSEPPAPFTAAELPGAMQQAFSTAEPPIKQVANEIVASFQAQDYSKAFLAAQDLTSRPGLTKEQVSTTTRATLTLSGMLQQAQTQGDQAATRTLDQYQRNK